MPEQSHADPAHQFAGMPTFTMNMQQVINQLSGESYSSLLLSRLNDMLSEIYVEIGDLPKGLAYQLQSWKILEKERPLHEDEFFKALIILGERYLLVNEADSADKIYSAWGKKWRYKKMLRTVPDIFI